MTTIGKVTCKACGISGTRKEWLLNNANCPFCETDIMEKYTLGSRAQRRRSKIEARQKKLEDKRQERLMCSVSCPEFVEHEVDMDAFPLSKDIPVADQVYIETANVIERHIRPRRINMGV